jgi:hypothetical protein
MKSDQKCALVGIKESSSCFDATVRRPRLCRLSQAGVGLERCWQVSDTSLKPGGLLAVIDRLPRGGTKPPKGVPKNRGGHGMPKQLLIDELTAAGFQALTIPNYWHGEDYCVVFRKP